MSKLILPTRVRVHKRASDSKRASNSKRSYHSWTNAWKTKFLYVIASRMLESTSFTSDSKRASDSKSLSILDLCLRNEVLIWQQARVRPYSVQMSERLLPEQCCQNSVDRTAGQSTFSDKARSTLLCINENNVNKAPTAIFKRPYCLSNGWIIRGWYKRRYSSFLKK